MTQEQKEKFGEFILNWMVLTIGFVLLLFCLWAFNCFGFFIKWLLE
jgi:hypothetical protein